jgi:iron(III) transport system ATP-binding protein
MTSIDIGTVSKAYRGRSVLQDVDLSVPDAAVIALLGPSGCGKTTLLRLIAGFERSDAGEIRLGADIADSPSTFLPPERRRVGYVPQEGALFPHLSVAGNAGYGLSRRDRQGPRIGEVLDLVGLSAFADRQPHELSGGQQQRAALARALAPKPSVILLDEPFNALDLDLRRRMSEDVVALLRATGTSVVLVTHDPGEAFATADLVAVMAGGRIEQCDTPAAVYHTPATADVARLTGGAVFLEADWRDGMVDTPLGRLAVRGGNVPLDGALVAMLRPEQIGLASAGEGCAAKVIDARFRGDHTTITVALGDNRFDLRVTETVDGDWVHLAVHGACSVFAKTAG